MGREFALQLDKKLHSIDEYWLVGRNEEELAKTKKKMHTKTRNFIADFNSRKALFPLVGAKQYTAGGKDACKLCRIWNGWIF